MRRLWAEFRSGAADDRAILLATALVWMALLALLASKGVNGLRFSSYANNLLLYFSALLYFLTFLLLRELWIHRPDRPIGFLLNSVRSHGLVARLARGSPTLLALAIYMPAFSAMKSAIPTFQPYSWDDTWIRIDHTLHGGDPWILLNWALGFPAVTSILSIFYHLWILLIYFGGVYFCCFQDNRKLRCRYLISYFAIWTMLGVGMAIGLASVGPVFVGPLLDNPRFDAQMEYLREADRHFPVLVLEVQDQLLAWHQSGNEGLGRGITAMPSMHVSLAFLFFLAMRQVSRCAGWVFGAFLVIIMVGSVHLAYHYAVDGYVSIVGTWLIWLAAGPLARRISRERAAPLQPVDATLAASG